ncbi:MAG TPA: HAD hydrolase-like protein [Bacteroidales bacterium]|nr:HAD hydrolase-like protein [Bacteroidales bacterium]HSA42610.1 HAD hydrolase-like protein [Bacteroidales bacterium]
MSSNISTIIWDWNGTLLNDMDICVDAINQLLAKRGLPLMTLEKYRRLFTFPVISYYERIGFDFSREPYDQVAIEFITIYFDRLRHASLFEGVRPVLDFFSRKGMRQAILSAMEQENLNRSVFSMDIGHYFSHISGSSDHYANGKTGQASAILKLLGSKPSESLIIGDTLHDYEVARETSCHCLLVSAGHQERERLLSSGQTVVKSLEDLPSLFNGVEPPYFLQ